MIIDYTLIILLIFSFLAGLFFGIGVVKFFSSDIVNKLENAFELQLEMSQEYFDLSTNKLIIKLNEKIEYFEKVNGVLVKTHEYLYSNAMKLELLNQNCDTRKELEFEIIKLKKIIQRLEKKR